MYKCNNSLAFPALKGTQANRDYYVCVCDLRMLPKLFIQDESDLPPEERSQRLLRKSRIPVIRDYIIENRNSYVFSSLSFCVDGEVNFEPSFDGASIGTLLIDFHANFYIADGQHRKAAIEKAIEQDPSLENESISMVIFTRDTLTERQSVFRDLNIHQVKTGPSYNVLCSEKPEDKQVLEIVTSVPFLSNFTSVEEKTLGKNNKEFLTYATVKKAWKTVLTAKPEYDNYELSNKYVEYLIFISKNFSPWNDLMQGKLTIEQRNQSVCFNSLFLQTFTRLWINELFTKDIDLPAIAQVLSKLNFSRTNNSWKSRAMNRGSIKAGSINIILTCNLFKKQLSIPLTPEEKMKEQEMEGQQW